MDDGFTIKQVSEQTGLSIPTLRYYEELGLINPINRLDNGHRRYTEQDVNRLQLLKKLKATGMPISQMQQFTALYREGAKSLPARQAMLEQHREHIQAQIELLCETLDLVNYKIALYKQEECEANE